MATILFADDCGNIREFCRQELEEEGYRVLLARDGKEALQVAQSERPDLAILDIWMPRINGLEAAERIAAIDPGIRVILFTNNDELCLRDPRSAFAAACVEKGDDFRELKRTIVAVLTSRHGKGYGAVPHPSHRAVLTRSDRRLLNDRSQDATGAGAGLRNAASAETVWPASRRGCSPTSWTCSTAITSPSASANLRRGIAAGSPGVRGNTP